MIPKPDARHEALQASIVPGIRTFIGRELPESGRREESVMRRPIAALMVMFAAVALPAYAEPHHATMDEAKSVSLKAASYVREKGPEAGTKAFMASKGEWHDRDLYSFMLDGKGVNIAHGGNREPHHAESSLGLVSLGHAA